MRITGANKKRKEAAELGLIKILGRDERATKKELSAAEEKLAKTERTPFKTTWN